MSNPTDPIRFSVPSSGISDRSRKLGRGLGALLGESRREEPLVRTGQQDLPGSERAGYTDAYARAGLASLPIGAIEPMPGQPRRRFDETALHELAASISARGVIQPIIVRRLAEGRYQLVAGERRWRAAQKAKLHEIPALVRDLDDREAMALALIENLQREDLNPVEEARAYQRLIEGEGLTQAEIAGMVDKSRSHVANLLRLLGLPSGVLDLVESGALSMGHARALIGHGDAAALARRAVEEKLSVREVERLVRRPGAGSESRRPAAARRDQTTDADIEAVQNHLEEFLGMTVRIRIDADPRSGAVTIRYRTLDQLDLICQKLTGAEI